MPERKELTPAEVYEKVTRRVAYLSKYTWLMRVALVLLGVVFLIGLFMDDLRAALVFGLSLLMMSMMLAQHNQHKLLLKLLPKPEERQAVD